MSVFPSLEEPGQNWRKKAVGKKQLGESPERKAGKETNRSVGKKQKKI